MTKDEINALLEGAYAQISTLPGYFVKFEDFRRLFNKLVSERSDSSIDIDKYLEEYSPKIEECYQPQGSQEVFKAFRIAPNKLRYIISLRKDIEKALHTINPNEDGWKPFAAIGSKVPKESWQKMGFWGIKNAVESVFGKKVEFKTGDISKHEAPLQIREVPSKGQEDNTTTSTMYVPEKNISPKQGSYIGESINKFAFFPKPKGSQNILGWDAAINNLATNIALEETWFYEEKDKVTKPILKNYLSYTFERLQFEDSLEKEKAQAEGRKPKFKILEDEDNAVWNTGLVNNIYEPIYAFFKRNNKKNPVVKQEWVFIAFDTANSTYQKIISNFPYHPEKPQYFDDPRELFYDINAGEPTLDWKHFIVDNIERLPIGFIKSYPTQFDYVECPDDLPNPQKEAYFKKLADAIYADENWKLFLVTRFKNALDIALSRVSWNYKTAIPVYYVKERKLQLLLPLALEKKEHIDVALVCNHKYDEKKGVNNYEGRTIFTMEMAYNNARLITRPDSDWLMAGIGNRK